VGFLQSSVAMAIALVPDPLYASMLQSSSPSRGSGGPPSGGVVALGERLG